MQKVNYFEEKWKPKKGGIVQEKTSCVVRNFKSSNPAKVDREEMKRRRVTSETQKNEVIKDLKEDEERRRDRVILYFTWRLGYTSRLHLINGRRGGSPCAIFSRLGERRLEESEPERGKEGFLPSECREVQKDLQGQVSPKWLLRGQTVERTVRSRLRKHNSR